MNSRLLLVALVFFLFLDVFLFFVFIKETKSEVEIISELDGVVIQPNDHKGLVDYLKRNDVFNGEKRIFNERRVSYEKVKKINIYFTNKEQFFNKSAYKVNGIMKAIFSMGITMPFKDTLRLIIHYDHILYNHLSSKELQIKANNDIRRIVSYLKFGKAGEDVGLSHNNFIKVIYKK